MNKQKKISPHPASQPILSRGSKMREIKQDVINNSYFGTTIYNVRINRLNYTVDELVKYIQDNPSKYCNEIMGVSCGDGVLYWPGRIKWEEYSPYWKWYLADGKCPNFGEERNPKCTKGCVNFFNTCV